MIPSPPPPARFGFGSRRVQCHGVVAEEIVARVNNDIITLTDYEKAEAALHHDVAEDCQACPADRVDAMYKDKQKDLLRDLIDQQLLVQRGKDEGISVETDVIKRLDDVRRQNNLASLDDLEKAVESEGLSWEDYKTQFRNGLLTQEVIHREMGSRIVIGHDEVKQYYDAHQKDFVRPEQVDLAEIFLDTQGKTPQEIEAIDQKADDYRNRILKGEEFSEIAKRYSEGSTKDKGGNLGTFERGQLSKQLEDVVFKMDKGQITEVIQTKTGYEILKVLEHFQAGLQPVEKVETEIMNKIYMQKMQPPNARIPRAASRRELRHRQAWLHGFRRRPRRQRDSGSRAHGRYLAEIQKEDEAQARLMKTLYVSGLQDGHPVTSLFLVREKEIRTSARTGSSWLQLELADRTGTISAKMWDNFAAIANTFDRDDVVQIRGRVKLYNGQKELTLEAVIPSAERDYDLADFLPHTKYDVEELYSRLRAAIAEMKNPFLQKLLSELRRRSRHRHQTQTRPRRDDHAPRFHRRPARTHREPRRACPRALGALSRTRFRLASHRCRAPRHRKN